MWTLFVFCVTFINLNFFVQQFEPRMIVQLTFSLGKNLMIALWFPHFCSTWIYRVGHFQCFLERSLRKSRTCSWARFLLPSQWCNQVIITFVLLFFEIWDFWKWILETHFYSQYNDFVLSKIDNFVHKWILNMVFKNSVVSE